MSWITFRSRDPCNSLVVAGESASQMRKMHQLVLAIAVLIALPSPTVMACFAGGTGGFSASHSCCKRMQMSCTSGSMSDSQRCCVRATGASQSEAMPPDPYSIEKGINGRVSELPLDVSASLSQASRLMEWSQTHPPGPDLSGSTHLRI